MTETVKDQAGAVAGTAKDEAAQVAGAATQAAADVAGTAKEQAAQVASAAKTQVGTLAEQAKQQLAEQASAQTQKAAATTRSFADQLQAMARGEATEGVAADIVRDISERVQQIAAKLENTEPQDLLDDVRRYARNKPGTFLVGALAAGFVGGRLAKGATAPVAGDANSSRGTGTRSAYSPGSGTAYAPSYGGTAAGAPLSGVDSATTGVGYPSTYGAETYPEEPRSSTFGGSI
jgi:hypothetical protein